MKKLTKKEQNEILEKLFDLLGNAAGECEIYENGAHVEYYGKAYGNGSDGYGSWKRNANGKFERDAIDGFIPTWIIVDLIDFFNSIDEITNFDLIFQLD